MIKRFASTLFLALLATLSFAQDLRIDSLDMPNGKKIRNHKLYRAENYFTITYDIMPYKLSPSDGKGVFVQPSNYGRNFFFAINDDQSLQIHDHNRNQTLCAAPLTLKAGEWYAFKLEVKASGFKGSRKIDGRWVEVMNCPMPLQGPFDIVACTQRTGALFRNVTIEEIRPEQIIIPEEAIIVHQYEVEINIWDVMKPDGDFVSVEINGETTASRIEVTKEKKQFFVKLNEGLNRVRLHAHNLGSEPPNTAAILIIDKDEEHQRILNSEAGEYAEILIWVDLNQR